MARDPVAPAGKGSVAPQPQEAAKAPNARAIVAKIYREGPRPDEEGVTQLNFDSIRYAAVTKHEGGIDFREEIYVARLVPLGYFMGEIPGAKNEADVAAFFKREGWSVSQGCLEVVEERREFLTANEAAQRHVEAYRARMEGAMEPKFTAGSGRAGVNRFAESPPKKK